IRADIGPPRLRETVARIDQVELVARRRSTGRRGLVLVRIRVERERVHVGGRGEEPGEHTGSPYLVTDPDGRRLATEEPSAAAKLGHSIPQRVPIQTQPR